MALKETLAIIIEQLSEDEKEYLMNGCMLENVSDIFKQHCSSWKLMDNYGGEDMGSDFWAVWRFGGEVFVKFYGWYASHYGSEYRGYEFVNPQQKIVTVYE
jgi:hypothetical protein